MNFRADEDLEAGVAVSIFFRSNDGLMFFQRAAYGRILKVHPQLETSLYEGRREGFVVSHLYFSE